jgi:hypothetical protein
MFPYVNDSRYGGAEPKKHLRPSLDTLKLECFEGIGEDANP